MDELQLDDYQRFILGMPETTEFELQEKYQRSANSVVRLVNHPPKTWSRVIPHDPTAPHTHCMRLVRAAYVERGYPMHILDGIDKETHKKITQTGKGKK